MDITPLFRNRFPPTPYHSSLLQLWWCTIQNSKEKRPFTRVEPRPLQRESTLSETHGEQPWERCSTHTHSQTALLSHTHTYPHKKPPQGKAVSKILMQECCLTDLRSRLVSMYHWAAAKKTRESWGRDGRGGHVGRCNSARASLGRQSDSLAHGASCDACSLE